MNDRDHTTEENGEAFDRRLGVWPERGLHLQQLQLGEHGRKRVVELMLRERREVLQVRLPVRITGRGRIVRWLCHEVTVLQAGRYLNLTMMTSPGDPTAELVSAVEAYRETSNVADLLERLSSIIARADIDTLIAAVEPYHDVPEVAGPVYERVVDERPNDARALVILANSYWLSGRGPEVVGELASRALAADPSNRGAWHLWALTESEPRARMTRWQQVSERFPQDELARAMLADMATSVAYEEHDADALHLAITSYESLLATARHPDQRAALESALTTLRGWRV